MTQFLLVLRTRGRFLHHLTGMSSRAPTGYQLQSAMEATSGKVTGNSPENYCLVSFPATWGQRAWDKFVNGAFDYACVWTGNENSPEKEWFEPWKKNVLDARARGMRLLVLGHEDCINPGGSQCQHTTPFGTKETFRLGGGQTTEVKWMNKQGISYKVYCVRPNPWLFLPCLALLAWPSCPTCPLPPPLLRLFVWAVPALVCVPTKLGASSVSPLWLGSW